MKYEMLITYSFDSDYVSVPCETEKEATEQLKRYLDTEIATIQRECEYNPTIVRNPKDPDLTVLIYKENFEGDYRTVDHAIYRVLETGHGYNPDRFPLKTEKDCRRKYYQAYQLDWMLSHGYSLDDVFDQLRNAAKQMFDEEDPGDFIKDHDGVDRLFDQAIDGFLYENGFDGTMFACQPEFEGAEMQDKEYMKLLFSLMSPTDGVKEARKALENKTFDDLKAELFRCGVEALEDFLGYELVDFTEDAEVTENRLNLAYEQMPIEEYNKFLKKYLNNKPVPEETERYFNVHFSPEGEVPYSVLVKARDYDDAERIIRSKELYRKAEDIKNIDSLTEISRDEYMSVISEEPKNDSAYSPASGIDLHGRPTARTLKCIFMESEDFERCVKDVCGEEAEVTYHADGIDYNLPEYDEGRLYERLASYFNVKEITSIHMDDADNVGVWIAYKE